MKLGLAARPSPLAAALIGYLVSAALLLGIVALRRPGRAAPGGSRRGRLWFCAVGLANGMAQLLLCTALSRGAVTLVAPLIATTRS